MRLQTLDTFLADPHSRNAWVREPGFHDLYVRKGARYLGDIMYPRVVDIANAIATCPGRGAFTTLVKRLHAQGETLYMENVLNERLLPKLLRMGFTVRQGMEPPCLYLLSTDTLRDV